MSDPRQRALRWLTLAVALLAAWSMAPFFVPLLFAAWTADLVQPLLRGLTRRLGGRRQGAAALVVLLVAGILLPLAGVAAAVVVEMSALLVQIRAAAEGHASLSAVLFDAADRAAPGAPDWAELASRYGAGVWGALVVFARGSASAIFAVLVFVVTLYSLTASGSRSFRWLLRSAPLPPHAIVRFARAFRETGRGLILGAGGTAVVQGLVATVAYFAIGVPGAAVFGPVTAVCALLPVLGTAIVWGPLAIGLALRGEYVRAIVLLAVGLGVIGLIDNLLRPILTRYGRLQLPRSIVFVSMIGGIAVGGIAGALLGPLAVRLTVEGLAILRDERRIRRSTASGTAFLDGRRGAAPPGAPT